MACRPVRANQTPAWMRDSAEIRASQNGHRDPKCETDDLTGFGCKPVKNIATVIVIGAAIGAGATSARAGDGSGTSNPDLLRGAYVIGCSKPDLCRSSAGLAAGGPLSDQPLTLWGELQTAPPSPQVASEPPGGGIAGSPPANCEDLKAAGVAVPECTGISLSAPPHIDTDLVTSGVGVRGDETDHATRLNWKVGLKGAYWTRDGSGSWQTGVNASANVETKWRGGSASLGGQTGVTLDQDGIVALEATSITGTLSDSLAKQLSGDFDANISVERELRTGTITQPAYIIDAGSEAKLTKGFGRWSAGLLAGVSREIWSASGQSDGSWTDNRYKSSTGLHVGAEAGLQISPIFRVEGRGTTQRLWYDTADPGSGVFRDGFRHELRGTLRGEWPLGLSASAYLGYALRTFDSAALSESGAWIYGAAASYRLAHGGTISATFDNAFAAPATSGTEPAQSDRSASVSIGYPLGRQVGARVGVSGGWTSYSGSTDWSENYAAGIGLDWQLARNMSMSADYAFGLIQTPLERRETHTVSAGINVSR